MKKQLPLILTLATGAGLFFWLKRKKSAGMNLRYEPIDIAIDSQRSAASLFSRIYYNLKLRLINNESANVNIRAINLQAFLKVADRQPRKIGDIVNNTGFQVPAKGQKEIKLDTSISTGGVIQIIRDLLIEGINFEINVNGFINTDLGRLNINFTKDFGSGRISSPMKKYEYKVTDCLDSRDCQIEIDSLTQNGNKSFLDFTESEKKRYFRLKRRQDKFIQQGK
jgi:hypothetical protein